MQMGTQLISFRLRDEEVALLMQRAQQESSPSLTAQKIIRQLLGTEEIPPDKLSSLLTKVGEFQEQVESIKGFVDDAIDQRMAAVDKLVNESVNQQMQTELLQMRSRFDELEQRLEQYFHAQRKSLPLFKKDDKLSSLRKPKQKAESSVAPLNQTELAQRLHNPETGLPYTPRSISRQKLKKDFPKWSEQRDPQGVLWKYEPKDGLFYPLEPLY
jgi:parvulin-like peptidyl-prolyl isomerase